MDLLAIIQDKIKATPITTGVFADHSTDHEPANKHDVFDIEATDTFFENTSRTTSRDAYDAYDAFSETVLAEVHNASLPTVKNKHVMPESYQSPNDWLSGTAEDAVEIPTLPFQSSIKNRVVADIYNIIYLSAYHEQERTFYSIR